MRRVVCLLVSCSAVLSVGSTALAAPSGSDDPDRAAANEVLVGFRPSSSPAERRAATRRVNATSSEWVATGQGKRAYVALVRLPRGASNARAIDRLKQDADVVLYAEPNWIVRTAATSNDPYFTDGLLWGMYGDASSPANQFGSQAAEAWAAGKTGSKSVYVGVIDEGIQFTHPDLSGPDLSGQVWTNPYDAADGVDNDLNGYVDDVHGWDFANSDNTIYDGGSRGRLDAHGTHVTGTIGARGGNAAGVAGVNWNVTAISGKFLGRNGGTTADAVRAVDYFTNLKTSHGLNIVATNNSWGGGGFSQALGDAITRANGANILFVAAAGNGGSDGVGDDNDRTASYPSNYTQANVIAVAAITSTGDKSSFSNYGLTTVDLGAPGSGIWSTVPFNRYASYSGTSMATPHVTGAAALYASTHPGATAAEIKTAILGSAVPTSSLAGKTVTGGRLNVSGF